MPRVDAGMVTSGLEIPGYRVVRKFWHRAGDYRALRGSVIGNLGAALQTIVGGNITILTNLLREDARRCVFELLAAACRRNMAPNAVIGHAL